RCRRRRDDPHAQGPAEIRGREVRRGHRWLLRRREAGRGDDRDHLRGRAQVEPHDGHPDPRFRRGRDRRAGGLTMSGEDLGFLFSLLLNGASIGMMYSLIALGFVLVYKATDAINFAQGEFVMMAGLIAAAILGIEGAPLIAAVVATLAIMIGFGFALERVVLRPLLGRPVVAVIMATIGLAAVLRGLTPVVFGGETRSLPLPIGDEPISIGPASLPPIQIVGAVVAVVFFLGFNWFFK